MNRYAIIERYSGHVWAVCDAESPVECDRQVAPTRLDEGQYEASSRYSADATYDVHAVPTWLDVSDGQAEDEISLVEKFPPCGNV